ncbi:MAG: heme exporter protein CcmD [Hyphomicrobium sp.]|nr:heme exporter protein CcmD [Hyphomicrobium sp.]
MDLGPHAAFIWASYAAVVVVVAGLVVWLWLDGERQRRRLTELEEMGLGRRTGRKQS